MRNKWPRHPLSEICELFTDGNWIETKDQASDGVRLLQTGNVGNGIFKDRREKARFISNETFSRLKCQEVLPGDCLISRLPDPVGRACIIPDTDDKMITAVDCSILRFRSVNTLPEFFCYFSQSAEYLAAVENKCSGATRKRISRKNLGQVKIPLPPLPEQKRIVAILDEAFAGIDAAVANTEKNLANARELFESYLNGVFTRKGDGWVEKKLGKMCERITKGSSPKWQGIEYVDSPGILFVTSENVGCNQMLFNKTKYVEEAFNQKDSKSILSRGDVLTNIVGASIGRTAVFDRDDRANINQAVCLLRCEPDKLVNSYLAYMLNSPFFRQILHDNEIDNARANLSLGFFRNLSIPVPSFEKQMTLVAEIEELHEQTQRLESIYQQKLAALAELKQSILQKAFAGELTAEPDKALAEAVA